MRRARIPADLTALVVGASGFIGSHLCRRLAAAGANVHAASRTPPGFEATGVRWQSADFTHLDIARRVLAETRPDVIVHLAGEVTGGRELSVVGPTFANNLTTSVNVLTAATEQRVERVVIAGSLEEPDGEDGLPIPSSPYAAAKWASGAYARMFHALYATPVVIGRTFMVYGPEQRNARKLIPYVLQALMDGTAPQLSSGAREIDWIYIDDVVDALIALAVTPGVEGRTIDIGSGRSVSIRDLVELMVNITGARVEPAFGALAERPMEQVRVANAEEAMRTLGWRARVGLEEGLSRTAAWFRQQTRAVRA